MEKPNCLECGGEMPVAAPTGRPAVYCGAVCRRSAEYAIRRSQVILTRAMRAQQDARRAHVLKLGWNEKERDAEVAFWDAEVGRLRLEMRQLLDGTCDEAGSPGTTGPRA